MRSPLGQIAGGAPVFQSPPGIAVRSWFLPSRRFPPVPPGHARPRWASRQPVRLALPFGSVRLARPRPVPLSGQHVVCESGEWGCTFAGSAFAEPETPRPPALRRLREGTSCGPGFPLRETCKCVCPPTTRTHDLPDPTSGLTRSGEASLPAARPDPHDKPARTARRATPRRQAEAGWRCPAEPSRPPLQGRGRTPERSPNEWSHLMTTTSNAATMTVTETATVLGISRSSAYECVRLGSIPSIRLGRRIVVPTQAINALLGSVTPEPQHDAAVQS
ncbi:MAG: helix-turn-helix domain-containing protein [Ilumatobacter sp.]|uniref:helix-turn-helix domain-containing protein n=2 Tax=Ilumatobacter sp. TaxID=1967498 RepID=UPI0032989BAB